MPEFHWTPKRDKAAELVADDVLTGDQIAAELKIHPRTLDWWKRRPEFQARVEERREAIRAAIRAEGIANKQNRIDSQNGRWQRLHQVIDARAADPTMQDVPGGGTGLLVRTYKAFGSGENLQIEPEYAVDTGLLKEMRELEKHTAQEMGQWAEKHEHSGEILVREYVGVPIDDV